MARTRGIWLAFAGCMAGLLALAPGAEAGISCVPFARAISAVNLQGDAWTWWSSAAGVYHRSQTPAAGAVLVMKRTERLRRGHVAVVAKILNSREILLDHANWKPGEIARGERAIDVSPNNDWSQVRVWHDDSGSYGVNVYPAYGFVHPIPPQADTPQVELAASPIPAFKPAKPRPQAAAVMVPGVKPKPGKTRGTPARARKTAPNQA